MPCRSWIGLKRKQGGVADQYRERGRIFMFNLWAALVCATGLWAIAGFTTFEPVKRPAGEAWVVTASEKIRSRPILVRAHVPYQAASVQ